MSGRFVWLGVGLLMLGCAEPKPAAPSASGSPAAAELAANQPTAGESNVPATSPPAAPAPQPGPPQAGTPAATPATAPVSSELVPADVGVGVKGRSLDKYDSGVESAIAQPAKALFAAKERIVFQIQIPQAMQLYKALNGAGPPSHEVFMREIIEANNIALPQLPPGQHYVYRPEEEELYVERPVR